MNARNRWSQILVVVGGITMLVGAVDPMEGSLTMHDYIARTTVAVGLLMFGTTAFAEEFKSLFDGKNLTGWEGNMDHFRVQDGAIVGGSLKARIPRNEFLTMKKEYSNFELRLKAKLIGENANGGIQIRSRRIPKHHEMIGYQVDMGQAWWGKLYDESRRRKVLAGPKDENKRQKLIKLGDWNDYVIRCEGHRIQIWLNGIQTVDYTEPDKSIEQTGLIGLQIHSGTPSESWYKDIRIKSL
jgi:hypothetical protein